MSRKGFYDKTNANNIRETFFQAGPAASANTVMLRMLDGFFDADASINVPIAREAAEKMEKVVTEYETLTNALSEDANHVIDKYFASLEKLPEDEKLNILKAVAFGLDVYRNETLQKGTSSADYLDALKNSEYCIYDCTDRYLKYEIKRKLENFNVSPAVMSTIMKELKKGEAPLFTAAALGKQSHDLKCIAAMELYIQNQGRMELEEAAFIACSTVEMQAIADAVHRNKKLEKAANVLLAVAIIALVLLLAYYFPQIIELGYEIGNLTAEVAASTATQATGFFATGGDLTEKLLGTGAYLTDTLHKTEMASEMIKCRMLLSIGFIFSSIYKLGKLPQKLTDYGFEHNNMIGSDVHDVLDGFARMRDYRKNQLKKENAPLLSANTHINTTIDQQEDLELT